MPSNKWNLVVEMNFGGQEWHLNLTASEQSLLTLLRSSYSLFEAQIKALADARPGARPAGIVDDALTLLRCLVFNQLQPYSGQHLKIRQV